MGFATVSSSLIALPGDDGKDDPVWLFAPGRPDKIGFSPIPLRVP
jgi:hypothetical protein